MVSLNEKSDIPKSILRDDLDGDSSHHSDNSFDDLLPPSKLYAGKSTTDIDADLDAMLEIDMEEVQILKKKEKLRFLKKNTRKLKRSCCSWWCCSCFKIDNTNVRVLQPHMYRRYKLCVIGPHWLGVMFTLGLLYCASYYFTIQAYETIGVMSAAICVLFTISATVNLFLVACKDPGIVRNAEHLRVAKNDNEDDDDELGEYAGLTQSQNKDQGEEEGWRWCGVCKVYQPPNAAHCADCNACVDGYDHHCPWMGICIGKDNYRAFIMFNLSWLGYLIYAATWVSALGPRFVGNHKED